MPGTIDVFGSHIKDVAKTGIAVFDKTVRESTVRVRHCKLEKTATRGAGFFPFAVSAQRWATVRHFAVGNVSFEDCDVFDTADRPFLQAWNPAAQDADVELTNLRVHNPYGCRTGGGADKNLNLTGVHCTTAL